MNKAYPVWTPTGIVSGSMARPTYSAVTRLCVGLLVALFFASGSYASDFDADDNADVLLRNTANGLWRLFDIDNFTVSSNVGLGIFSGANWTHQTNADFDGDGDADVLIRRDEGAWRVFEIQNNAVVGFSTMNLFQNTSWQFRGAVDFDNDGDADILARKPDSGLWRIFQIQNRQVVSSAGVLIYQNADWAFQAAADYDGDGDGDVLLRKTSTGLWRLFEVTNRAVVSSASPGALFNGANWNHVASGDRDKDATAEILLRNTQTGTWRVFQMMNRVVSQVGSINLYANASWGHAKSGDFDGDGDQDVLLRKADTGAWRFFNIELRQTMGNSASTLWQNTAYQVQESAPPASAEFVALGSLDANSFASDISADGNVVVGNSGDESFRWTRETGMVGIGSGSANAVNEDGSVVVGSASFGARNKAFRWTETVGQVELGSFPEARSFANDVSADGSIVVGWGQEVEFGDVEAFRWTQQSGGVSLGTLPDDAFGRFSGDTDEANGISADGTVVVGVAVGDNGGVIQQAFRWTQATGMVGLGQIPERSAGSPITDAKAISADGATVVGEARDEGFDFKAFRWTEATGMVALAGFPQLPSRAFDVNADGSVIVGRVLGESPDDSEDVAFIWTEATGMRSIQALLASKGVNLPGWTLQEATGVSADGKTVVGYGINPDGETEGWLVKF